MSEFQCVTIAFLENVAGDCFTCFFYIRRRKISSENPGRETVSIGFQRMQLEPLIDYAFSFFQWAETQDKRFDVGFRNRIIGIQTIFSNRSRFPQRSLI